jgi:hypothetical protein
VLCVCFYVCEVVPIVSVRFKVIVISPHLLICFEDETSEGEYRQAIPPNYVLILLTLSKEYRFSGRGSRFCRLHWTGKSCRRVHPRQSHMDILFPSENNHFVARPSTD